MRNVLLTFLIFIHIGLINAHAEAPKGINYADVLLKICEKEDVTSKIICLTYISGIMDGIEVERTFYVINQILPEYSNSESQLHLLKKFSKSLNNLSEIVRSDQLGPYCGAKKVSTFEIKSIIIKYFRNFFETNPNSKDDPSNLLILYALIKAFPCPMGK